MVVMYPKDRHQTLLWKYEEVQSIRIAAKFCRISKSTAQRWLKEHESPKERKVRASPVLSKSMPLVESEIGNNPFITCRKLAQKLEINREMVRRCIHKLGFTYKKAKYFGKAKNALALTCTFLRLRDKYIAESRPIFSIDETGFGRFSFQHRKGWAIEGKPLCVQKDKPRQTSSSVMACASKSQWIHYTQHIGGTNLTKFCEFLKSLSIPSGSVLLMDNASIHKGDEVESICKEKGFLVLYTPPYSPWFNPIEACFSHVKRLYPEKQSIQECFASLTPDHFKAFFVKSLGTYGINDIESECNKSEMMKPYARESENSTRRMTRPPVNKSVVKKEYKDVGIKKHIQDDGTLLIVRTKTTTVETIETYGDKTRTDTIVQTTTTTRIATPRKCQDIKQPSQK